MPDIDLDRLLDEALTAVAAASDLDELEQVRVQFTGKKSDLVALQKQMGSLDPDERRTRGQALNAFKRQFSDAFDARREALADEELRERLEAERLDLTLPPRRVRPGRPHLLTQVLEEIVDTFVGMGYQVAEGPEVEDATYNFDLMNIPPDHPARQEMDTIYVAGDESAVLRTHTSPVQARVMLEQAPPIAVVAPGRVFRQDTPDATHSPVFQQVEGLLVDRGITMAHLRGTLLEFARTFFGPSREIRLRPSFFPFTEPSAEVDVTCGFCDGGDAGCRVCGGSGWIEVLGAGMVDPNVLSACGLDPDQISGFAFGIGVERMALLRHGVTDIRHFYESDARFLARF